MAEPTPAAVVPGDRRGPFLAALASLALALTIASGIAGLGDTDPYRHLTYARALWDSGFTLRGHPFLPYTLLGKTGVDFWWGFHLWLVPFTAFGTLWGARLAGACVAGLSAGGLAWLLRRSGQPIWLFALLPWFCSPSFAFRDHLARPAHLTVALLLISLVAGAGRLKPGYAGAAALVHALVHLSAPVSVIATGLGALGALLGAGAARQPVSAAARVGGRALVWSVGGLALGLLLRPDRDTYPALAVAQAFSSLRAFGQPRLPHLAPELIGISADHLASETGLAVAFLAVAWFAGRRTQRAGDRPLILAGALLCAFSLALCFLAARFLDYLLPALAFTSAMLWPRELQLSPRARTWVLAAVACVAAVQAGRHVTRAWALGNQYIDPPETFEALADGVRKAVPPGSMLFTDDPFITGVIYASLPEYRYVVAYDPGMLYAEDPGRFWTWHHLVVSGIACDRPSCSGALATPEAIITALGAFDAQWIITSYPPGPHSLQSVIGRFPDAFEHVGYARGPVTGLHLWKVRRPPAQ